MRKWLDRFWVGLLMGLAGPLVGFWLYGQYYCWKYFVHFSYYYHEVFLGTKPYQSSIATLSLLFNLIPFFIFLSRDYIFTCRGIMGATLLYAPFIIYMFFY